MAISRACYCTREDVKRALDVKETARNNAQIDRAIEAASELADSLLSRKFFTEIATRYFDWPNLQSAAPWRLWLDANELADTTSNVPVVTVAGSVIPAANINWEPIDYAPPFTYVEMNRSSVSVFSGGSTPQRAVSIAGTFGFWTKVNPAGSLAAAMNDTTSTTATVSSSATPGVGDVMVVDSEKMLVTDRAMVSTGQTQQSGLTTALASDVSLGVTDGTKYQADEILLLDSERVLVVDISGNTLTVKRAFDGSVLAAHSGATIYAPRLLTITRGDFGTTAATHLNSAAVSVNRVPRLVKSASLASAEVQVSQELSGYARPEGGPGGSQSTAAGLAAKWDSAITSYGRQARQRVI